MANKTPAKPQPPAKPSPRAAFTPVRAAALVIVLVAAVAAGVYWWQPAETASPQNDPQAAQSAAATPQAEPTLPVPEIAKHGPHPQANLPQLNFPPYPPTRPAEIVRAVYKFAAEHPEILSYVPCYCGCERMGHKGNDDCFVRSRNAKGDVIEWEDHGMECAVCIDVANRSLQLFSSGASAKDIRATIEKEFGSRYPQHTPTPKPGN